MNNLRACAWLLLVALVSCGSEPKQFEMTVDKVDHLQGFVLKGLSVSGTIALGCIANEDRFTLSRGDQLVLEEQVRILNVADLPDPEAFDGTAAAGAYVTLYLPDAKLGAVLPGDILSSLKTSCKPTP